MKPVLIIAHRGASAVAPESTRAAIRAAARSGAGMVELDVQMTRDGRLVIFHDDRLERTTNGRGRLTQRRYAELTRLEAGRWFHPRFAGESILLVSQAFRVIPPRMGVNLELKRTRRRARLLVRLRRILRGAAVRGRLLVSAFDPALLQPLQGSRLARALICRRDPDRSLQRAIALGCLAWHPFHTLVTPRRIARAHAAGLRVHAWTVDDVRLARRLIRLGVDGLFTNDPARLATRRLR
ncbi:MAG: glycerophosphoryl diester phosphodiesterase [Candidatus Omnitrophica bacterium]|nr:glycerophosphoryl diester phosphodiesterase [Candidatus Omnitrophota bacterium]